MGQEEEEEEERRKRASIPKKAIITRFPFHLLLRLASFVETLFIQFPIRVIVYTLLPHYRPHPQWSLLQSLFVDLFKLYRTRLAPLHDRYAVLDKTILPKVPRLWEKQDGTAVWIPPIEWDSDLVGDLKAMFEAGNGTTPKVLAFWYGNNHQYKEIQRAGKEEKVYLYFHGGGYWERSAQPSDPTINCLRILLRAAAAASQKSKKNNVLVPNRGLAVDYRLTDETSFPGILCDAIAAWKYLVKDLEFKPKNIIIGGDSAGGNLTLALVRYLSENQTLFQIKQDEAIADGIILFSPWVDVSLSYYLADSSSSKANAKTDYLNPLALKTVKAALVQGLPKNVDKNRLLSCITKDTIFKDNLFNRFPRALLFGG